METHPVDAWIDALPDDDRGPCPCGCGKSLLFVKNNEARLKEHEDRFRELFLSGRLEPKPTNADTIPKE